YADTRRFIMLDRKTGKIAEEAAGVDLLTAATGQIDRPYDRSVNRFTWLQGPFGKVQGIHFEAEDQGYVRQYLAALQGAGILLALTSGHSDHDLVFSKDSNKAVFVRTHFGLPATLQVLSPKGKDGEKREYKREGQHVVFDPPLETHRLDPFNT